MSEGHVPAGVHSLTRYGIPVREIAVKVLVPDDVDLAEVMHEIVAGAQEMVDSIFSELRGEHDDS